MFLLAGRELVIIYPSLSGICIISYGAFIACCTDFSQIDGWLVIGMGLTVDQVYAWILEVE
jgi:hypothetical protein